MNRFTELLIEWPISAEGNLSRYTTPAVAIKQCLCRPVATPAAPPHTNRGRIKEAPNAKAMLITPGHCVEQNTPPISTGAFVRDSWMLRYQLVPDCLAALVLCMGRRQHVLLRRRIQKPHSSRRQSVRLPMYVAPWSDNSSPT